MTYKEQDLVLCTVTKIEGTTVFVDLDTGEKGTIAFSEIAAGRIRNLREHVTIGKKIVCKILKLSKNQIELSFRRVTAQEREFIIDIHKKETIFRSILKSVVQHPQEKIDEIKKDMTISDFLDEIKENKKLIEKYFSKDEEEKINELLKEKKEKEKEIKKVFTIKTYSETGIKDIKEILYLNNSEAEIIYLGSSKFSISVKAKNFKEAEKNIIEILEKIKSKAKENKAEINILDKK